MTDLPTISVDDQQLARITAAFPGETIQEKVEAYQQWLIRSLRQYVVKYEIKQLEIQHAAEIQALRESAGEELP